MGAGLVAKGLRYRIIGNGGPGGRRARIIGGSRRRVQPRQQNKTKPDKRAEGRVCQPMERTAVRISGAWWCMRMGQLVRANTLLLGGCCPGLWAGKRSLQTSPTSPEQPSSGKPPILGVTCLPEASWQLYSRRAIDCWSSVLMSNLDARCRRGWRGRKEMQRAKTRRPRGFIDTDQFTTPLAQDE